MDAALKILAVDNEPSVTLSMRYIFAAPRYELTRVDNGMDALARLDADSDRYDIIIVDQKMPHLTGVELVSAIRARGIRAKIIVYQRTCRRKSARPTNEWTFTSCSENRSTSAPCAPPSIASPPDRAIIRCKHHLSSTTKLAAK